MSDQLEIYLNDHLAGSMVGTQLARDIRDRAPGGELGELMARLAEEIEADKTSLEEVIELLGLSRDTVKKASGWLAEKAARVKHSGLTAGDAGYGLFMAIETLRLGVTGKRCMWAVLHQLDRPELANVDLVGLLVRASEQESALEEQRVRAAPRAF